MDAPNHDTDFFEWTQQQSAALRSHPLDCGELDTEKLAEEIEHMGLEQIRKTSSFLVQMLVHLLKLHLARLRLRPTRRVDLWLRSPVHDELW
jgi:hypothetical protein